jgi:hypothetical protein
MCCIPGSVRWLGLIKSVVASELGHNVLSFCVYAVLDPDLKVEPG